MNKLFLLIITILVFSSCAGKFSWNRPSQKYRECLRVNPDKPSRCDIYKEQYEEQIDSLRGISEDPGGGGGLYSK
ncbi:MAG TPA: hypothetical protein VHT73_08215 [Thermodesulfobacteriota bacterium]|nr:hypothetical protein [Thermodesulfobacteriota bacterium]